jgi:predicted dehydrogenase
VPGFIKMVAARDDIRITKVWDHDPARAQRRATELNAKVVTEYAAILADPEIAAVAICTETNRHEPIALATATARKPVFIEKPLGFAAADALRMADAIEAAKIPFQTGYFMRSNPIMQFLKQQVAAGAFGKITRVRASNVHGAAMGGWFDTEWRWMADPSQSGCGGFGDLGTHVLDLMLWMFGQVSDVAASLSMGTGRYPGCDENGEAILNFKSGTIGTIAAGWDDVANPVGYQINGTEGIATVFNGQLYFQSKHVEGADGKTPWTTLPPAMPHAFELFLDAIVGKDVPLVTAKETAYRNVVMEAIYTAANSKTWTKC